MEIRIRFNERSFIMKVPVFLCLISFFLFFLVACGKTTTLDQTTNPATSTTSSETTDATTQPMTTTATDTTSGNNQATSDITSTDLQTTMASTNTVTTDTTAATTIPTTATTTTVDPYADYPFVPGEGGTIVVRTPSELAPGKFGGFVITLVERHHDSITSNIVEMWFPAPSTIGASSYNLQYLDTADQTWKNYQHDEEDVIADASQDNFSLSVNESLSLRLKANGGTMDGYTSNEQSYELPIVDCAYQGYMIEYGINDEGIMAPLVGFTLEASFSAINFSGETDVDVSDTLVFSWYRVDPVTYEMILIEEANGETTYDTTLDDVGYHIGVKAEGDGTNSSGFSFFVLDSETVITGNLTHITGESATGFTVNLYYTVNGLDPDNFIITDQDWNDVDVISIVQGDNEAIYHVTIDDSTIQSGYNINYENDSWQMQFDMSSDEFPLFTAFYYVELPVV